jgi:hypothetical protein
LVPSGKYIIKTSWLLYLGRLCGRLTKNIHQVLHPTCVWISAGLHWLLVTAPEKIVRRLRFWLVGWSLIEIVEIESSICFITAIILTPDRAEITLADEFHQVYISVGLNFLTTWTLEFI